MPVHRRLCLRIVHRRVYAARVGGDIHPAVRPAMGNHLAAGRRLQQRLQCGDILLQREAVIRASCRYSIKAGYELSDEQIEELMKEITELDAIPNCPHGRPIAIVLQKSDLQKGFKRTV